MGKTTNAVAVATKEERNSSFSLDLFRKQINFLVESIEYAMSLKENVPTDVEPLIMKRFGSSDSYYDVNIIVHCYFEQSVVTKAVDILKTRKIPNSWGNFNPEIVVDENKMVTALKIKRIKTRI